MESKRKKIGIIGLGVMGKRHCEAVKGIPGAELTAVCDRHNDSLQFVTEKWAARFSYLSWQKILHHELLDLLIISTNGPSHAEIALAAMEAGIPRILCEKPMATSLQAAHQMVQACETRGVRLAVNHIRRWSESYRRLKKVLDEKVIGEIRHIVFEMGGGQLASNGGHFWDLVRFLTGQEPKTVLGFVDKTGTPHPRGKQYSDPGAYGLLWLQDDSKVFFNMSENYGAPSFVEILGSVGRIIIDERLNRYEIQTRKPEERNQPMTRRPDLIPIPFDGQIIDMIGCTRSAIEELLGDGPLSCTVQDGLKNLEISIGVHYSEKLSNQPVHFPLPEICYKHEYQFT